MSENANRGITGEELQALADRAKTAGQVAEGACLLVLATAMEMGSATLLAFTLEPYAKVQKAALAAQLKPSEEPAHPAPPGAKAENKQEGDAEKWIAAWEADDLRAFFEKKLYGKRVDRAEIDDMGRAYDVRFWLDDGSAVDCMARYDDSATMFRVAQASQSE
jgi:hypothetical protein